MSQPRVVVASATTLSSTDDTTATGELRPELGEPGRMKALHAICGAIGLRTAPPSPDHGDPRVPAADHSSR